MISVLREHRLSYAVLWEGRRTRLGTATASLRPRPDRRVTRRLFRHGSPRPGEAGRWDVESRATGLATALRSRGRARPAQSHRRRTRIQTNPQIVDAWGRAERIFMQMPGRHRSEERRVGKE